MKFRVMKVDLYVRGKYWVKVLEENWLRVRVREFVSEGQGYKDWYELPHYDVVPAHTDLARTLQGQLEKYLDEREKERLEKFKKEKARLEPI